MAGMTTQQRELLGNAAACERHRAHYPGDDAEHVRAREMLSGMATACRAVVAVFDIDPTLADEPYGTGRFRGIDLLNGLVSQLRGFLRLSVFANHPRLRPREQRWEEAEALYERALWFAEILPQVVPRAGAETVEGVRAVSRERLAAQNSSLATAAAIVRSAVADALRLAHPDPDALALIELAAQLERHAAELDVEHSASCESMTAALFGRAS